MMGNDKLFFYFLPVFHAILISIVLPYSPVVALMLIADVAIISSYGVRCKGNAWKEVAVFMNVFGVGNSYRGAIVLYMASYLYWQLSNPAVRVLCIIAAFMGSLSWFRLPYRCYWVMRKGRVN